MKNDLQGLATMAREMRGLEEEKVKLGKAMGKYHGKLWNVADKKAGDGLTPMEEFWGGIARGLDDQGPPEVGYTEWETYAKAVNNLAKAFDKGLAKAEKALKALKVDKNKATKEKR